MKTTLLALLAVAAGCTGAAQAGPGAAKTSWNGTIGSGETVYIRNINGAVRVVPGSGDKVSVKGKARGGAKLEVVPHAGGVTICGIPKAKSYSCDKNGELNVNGNTDGNSSVDLEITVPKGAVLDVESINGGVNIAGAGKSAHIETVNGDLEIETNGPVEAETVNGAIAVKIKAKSLTGDVDLETVNGSIHVTLPSQVDADVRASLLNGEIASKRALSDGVIKRDRLTGRLGKGGHRISMETVNGSIELE